MVEPVSFGPRPWITRNYFSISKVAHLERLVSGRTISPKELKVPSEAEHLGVIPLCRLTKRLLSYQYSLIATY